MTAKTPSSPPKTPLEHLVGEMLQSLGYELQGELRETPARVAELWTRKLLWGEGVDLEALLSGGTPSTSRSPVALTHLGVHLVCPHHLTVAFGEAHLAYVPNGKLASLGALSRLVQACTARLVLQEEACDNIATAIEQHLGAAACAVKLEATHPCHNLTAPRAHKSRIVTWASTGGQRDGDRLRRLLRDQLSDSRSR